jgi:hypothetical protein
MGKHEVLGAGRHGDMFWEEEKNNFGMKMMKNMGWKQGDGLGKTNDGETSYVRSKRKKDNAGIGAGKIKGDDMMSAATDMYSDLLKRLNANAADNGMVADNGEADLSAPKAATAGDGLKKYVARKKLYTKFKAAKDSWKSSASSLSEILGKQKPKSAGGYKGGAVRKGALTDANADAAADDADGDTKITTSSSSMRDYFTKKMEASRASGAASKFMVAGNQGFSLDFQAAYYQQQLGASQKSKQGLGVNSFEAAPAQTTGWGTQAPRAVCAGSMMAAAAAANAANSAVDDAGDASSSSSSSDDEATAKAKKRSEKKALKKAMKAAAAAAAVAAATAAVAAAAAKKSAKKQKEKSKKKAKKAAAAVDVDDDVDAAAAAKAAKKAEKRKRKAAEALGDAADDESKKKKKKKSKK